jgi:hypothetical protein
MKLLGCITIVILLFTFVVTETASATPSTTYWTPATSDVQPFNVWHIGVDNYFRLYQTNAEQPAGTGAAGPGAFFTDVGLTVGVLPFEKLNMEVGTDLLVPGRLGHASLRSFGSQFTFNAKLGTPEGAFFGSWFPALNVGIFNVGTMAEVTDMNIVDFIVGKSLGPFGRIHAGYYYGNPGSALMHQAGCKNGTTNPKFSCNTQFGTDPAIPFQDDTGRLQNDGALVGYDYGFWKVKDKEGNEYNKWILAADYASGKNFIGGGGVGIYHFFTKDISLLTGPVWFNDKTINGQWKWTIQLDINF